MAMIGRIFKKQDGDDSLPEFAPQVQQPAPAVYVPLIADYEDLADIQITTDQRFLMALRDMQDDCPGFVSRDTEIICIDRQDLNKHEALALNRLISIVRAQCGQMPMIRQTTRSVFESWLNNSRETSLQEQAQEGCNHVNELLLRAIHRNATDIHLEIKNNKTTVFLRIYGKLCIDQNFDKLQGLKIINAIWHTYVNQAFSAGEAAKDGRFIHHHQTCKWLCRVSYGYSKVNDTRSLAIRLRDMQHVPALTTLGYHESQLEVFKVSAGSRGITLIVGAVNSGKSTTQTALMRSRPILDKNLEISDQVEVELDNFIQLQLPIEGADDIIAENKERLRRLPTRHDVDFIAINEIRDKETAAMAASMMLQGAAGVASIHGSSWPDAINRLVSVTDLGISADILFSESFLTLVVVQSLVSVLCASCKLAEHPDPFWQEYYQRGFGPAACAGVCFQRPEGCADCRHSGVQGLTLVAETIPITQGNRALLMDTTRPQAMRAWMRAANVLNIHQHAYRKIVAGQLDPLLTQGRIGGFSKENIYDDWHAD